MSTLEIEARNVIFKIVLQFCKKTSLQQTFQKLQNKCQVSLNTEDNFETFTADINNGRWDALLPQVAQLKLLRKKLEDLYEQIMSPGFSFQIHLFWDDCAGNDRASRIGHCQVYLEANTSYGFHEAGTADTFNFSY